MMIMESPNHFPHDSQKTNIRCRVDLVPLTLRSINRLHLCPYIGESTPTVDVAKATINLAIPQFSDCLIRFACKREDSSKVRFVIGPTVIARSTGWNLQPLNLR